MLECLVDRALLGTAGDEQHYRYHDLIRLLARERAGEHTDRHARAAAVHRAITWYAERLYQQERAFFVDYDSADQVAVDAWLDRRRAALQWFDIERTTIVDLVRQAFDSGFDDLVARLCEHLFHFVDHHRLWPEWKLTHEIGLAAARRADDRQSHSRLLCSLGLMYWEQQRYDLARDCQQRSLELARGIGDHLRIGWAATHLGNVLLRQGECEHAVDVLREAIAEFRQIGDAHGEAWAHTNLGDAHRATGNLSAAIDAYREAVEVRDRAGDLHGGVFVASNLALALLEAGLPEAAEQPLRLAITLARDMDDPREEARATGILAQSLHAQPERRHEAGRAFQQAAMLAAKVSTTVDRAILYGELGSMRRAVGDSGGALQMYLAALAELPPEAHAFRTQISDVVQALLSE